MRLSKKEEYYKPDTRKATALAVALAMLSVLLFAGFSLLSMEASDRRMGSREMVTDLLCTTETPCRIILEAHSDKEPVNLEIMSPSGNVIKERDMEKIDSSDDGLEKTLAVYSEEMGDWLLSYDRRMNNSISFSVKQEYTGQVSIQDVKLEQGQRTGTYYLKFTPVYRDGSDTETMLHCSVTMELLPVAKRAGMAYIGEVTMNRTARVQLKTDNFPSGDYKISVSANIGGDRDSMGQASVTASMEMPETVSGNAIHASVPDADADQQENDGQDGGEDNGQAGRTD